MIQLGWVLKMQRLTGIRNESIVGKDKSHQSLFSHQTRATVTMENEAGHTS